MDKWFPQLKQTEAGKDARLRLVTFPNSGSAENVYTGADKTEFGGAKGRRDNALMKWAKSAKVEVWAAQPPGRDTRMREDCLGSAKEIAAECFAVCEKGLFEGDAPWALFAHSMGTWAAYEFALLCRAKGHRAPSVFVASGFPSPSCATADRPWTPNAGMDEDAFKAECRGWSINEVIFSPSMWKMYEKLLRTDFQCFDAYPEWTGENAALAFPVRGFYGTDDKRATKEKVSGWADIAPDFKVLSGISGHHLFVYDEEARCDWFKKVVTEIDSYLPMPPMTQYKCTAKKGAACRAGCELSTPQVQPEMDHSWIVDVVEEKENSKGTVRLHIVAYTPEGGDRTVVDCWASKKLFEYKGKVAAVEAPKPANGSADAATPPAAPAVAPTPGADAVSSFSGTTGTLYTVTGKNGAMMRAGCELDTAELGVTLGQGAECYVVEEAKNAKGSVRAHIVVYTEAGKPYAAIDGWCTAKFLTVVDKKKVPLPEVGAKPFAAVFPRATGSGTCVLFPGQGAQKVGMLAPYADTPGVTAMFKEASKIFGLDLLDLVEKGPVEKLNDTRFSQVAVFLTSMAAVKKLQREDPKAVANATVTAGFSLGEYSALCFAGVLELDTALKLLKIRGEAMGAACDLAPSGMMTVVGLEDDALKKMMPEGVSIANQLFPKGRVLSGSKDGLKAVEDAVKEAKIAGSKTIVQPVSGAFHSPYMATAADKLREVLADARLGVPQRTVYSNVTARPHKNDVASIKEKMCEQLMAGVLWEDTIRHMATEFPDIENFYEPAPGRQLTSMMRRIEPKNQPKMKNI